LQRKRPSRGKRPTPKAKPHTARDGSKKAEIIRLLERAKGATLAELMQATGWQAHRYAGSSQAPSEKAQNEIDSFRTDKGDRTYRVKGLSSELARFYPAPAFQNRRLFLLQEAP
jgi:hypothetical protein